MNYTQDFEKMVKESLKRITAWVAQCFIHDKSYSVYYHVPDTFMPLLAVSTMALPTVQTTAKEDEVVMKVWMENFRPVRQRTVTEKRNNLRESWAFTTKQTEHSYICRVYYGASKS